MAVRPANLADPAERDDLIALWNLMVDTSVRRGYKIAPDPTNEYWNADILDDIARHGDIALVSDDGLAINGLVVVRDNSPDGRPGEFQFTNLAGASVAAMEDLILAAIDAAATRGATALTCELYVAQDPAFIALIDGIAGVDPDRSRHDGYLLLQSNLTTPAADLRRRQRRRRP